jgi:hypothetical protein
MANGVYLVRLSRLLQGLLALEPHDTKTVWRSLVREYPLKEWVNAIDLHTLGWFQDRIEQRLITYSGLASTSAVNWEQQSRGLPCTDTKGGQYRRRAHLYIGSATCTNGGLKYRFSQHKSLPIQYQSSVSYSKLDFDTCWRWLTIYDVQEALSIMGFLTRRDPTVRSVFHIAVSSCGDGTPELPQLAWVLCLLSEAVLLIGLRPFYLRRSSNISIIFGSAPGL